MVKITEKEKAKIVRHYRKVLKQCVTKESVREHLEGLWKNKGKYVEISYGTLISHDNILVLLEKMRKS